MIYFLRFSLAAAMEQSFSTVDATGSWQKGQIGNKYVILTDMANSVEHIDIHVPEDGFYQLYISLHHNWKKYCPFLYIEAVDSKRKKYCGYIFSEPRWYMKSKAGRWEMRSPSAGPFWYLHKGRLKLKFWLESKSSPWERKDSPMEAQVAIHNFILLRINKSKMEQENTDFLR